VRKTINFVLHQTNSTD